MKIPQRAAFQVWHTSVGHSLASKPHLLTPVCSPGSLPVSQANVCCGVAASALMEISGSKDLSCLIVPQCLRPQASNCEAILYYPDFLTLTCGFPSENRSLVSILLPYLQSCSRNWLCHNLSLSLSPCVFFFLFFFCCTKSP